MNCLNHENYHHIYEDRVKILLIKEGKYYFPIYKLKKDGKSDKKIILTKSFLDLNMDEKKLFDELISYFNSSCINNKIKYRKDFKFQLKLHIK